jgi:hypothetical protein
MLAATGCGEPIERQHAVALGEVPAAALIAAQQVFPAVDFDTAWKIKVDGQDAYELRGKTMRGELHDVEVSPAGRVLDVD